MSIKINFITIVISTIVVLFGFIIIVFITEMSKLIVPVSFMGGLIRGGIIFGLFSVLLKVVNRLIKKRRIKKLAELKEKGFITEDEFLDKVGWKGFI